jgi:hypothetical protein
MKLLRNAARAVTGLRQEFEDEMKNIMLKGRLLYTAQRGVKEI